MAEQFPAVTLPVLPGMREDVEPQTAPVGTITSARNVRFPRAGMVQSRWGLSALSITSDGEVPYTAMLTASGPDFVHPCPGGFVFGAQGFGYRYDVAGPRVLTAGSYSTAQPRGKLDVSAREELTPTATNILTPWPLSTAVSGNLVATCHAVGNGQIGAAGAIVGNQHDGADPVPVAGPVVRVFTHDGQLVSSSFWRDAQSAAVVDDALGTLKVVYQTGTSLLVRSISAAGKPSTVASAIGTLATATSYWAVCRWPGIGWAIIYQSAAASLTVQRMAGNAVTASAVIGVTAAAGVPVSIYADAANLWTGWAQRAGASWDAGGRVFNVPLTGFSTYVVRALGAASPELGPPLYGPSAVAGTVLALVARSSPGSWTPSVASTDTIAYTVDVAGTVTAGAVNRLILPLSAPFANGLWWARHVTHVAGNVQVTRAVLLDFQEARAGNAIDASRWLQYPKIALVGDQFPFGGDTGAPVANVYLQHLHSPVQLSSGEWVMGIPRLVRHERLLPQSDGEGYLALCEWLRFATNCDQQVKTVGEDVLAGGSLTSIVSGLGLYEANIFASGPALPSQGLDVGLFQPPSIAAITAGAAGFMAAGVYQYRAEIELIDARGRRWRSAPSNARSVTTVGATGSVSITVEAWLPLLRAFSLSPITSRLVVHIYRTAAGGFNFQRVTPPQGAPVPHTAGTFTFVDREDAVAQGQHEFIYTDGGVLQNDHPPSCRFVADTEDRVWLGGLWDPNIIQSSKTIVPGEGIAFSDLDAFKVDLKEPCTGLAAQDGILFAFTATRVYAIQGLGPNQQGQGAWDDAKRELSRSTGCIDWRSIVETSAGVFYQSERGIMLVPRGGGEPQFVGGPVQQRLRALGGVISGAAVCEEADGVTVRFTCGAGTLVLDLVTFGWSYDEPPAGAFHVKVCDTESGPVLGRRDLAGAIAFDLEQIGSTTDQGAPISSFVSWAPVRPGGLAGWGFFVSALSVFARLDGLPFPATALTLSAAIDNDVSGTATRPTMVDFQPVDYRRLALRNRQGCAATLSFQTAGAPWRFVGWTVETMDLDGPRRTPPAEYI